jgi:hypothetical protein
MMPIVAFGFEVVVAAAAVGAGVGAAAGALVGFAATVAGALVGGAPVVGGDVGATAAGVLHAANRAIGTPIATRRMSVRRASCTPISYFVTG